MQGGHDQLSRSVSYPTGDYAGLTEPARSAVAGVRASCMSIEPDRTYSIACCYRMVSRNALLTKRFNPIYSQIGIHAHYNEGRYSDISLVSLLFPGCPHETKQRLPPAHF